MNNEIPDLPTKDEVEAHQKENKQKPQFNDDSKINIINNNKTLLSSKVNCSPAPINNLKKNEISNSIDSNSNDINYNSNQINQNNVFQNQITPNNNFYPNQMNPNNNIYQNQMNPNNNINYGYQNPQMMPVYQPHPNQMNILQPVIIQQSYNQQNNINIRKRVENIREQACCCLILFYLSLCFKKFLCFLCCYIISHLTRS